MGTPVVAALASILILLPAHAQPRLVLTVNGAKRATVAPGQAVTVHVAVSGGPAPAIAMVIGPDGIGSHPVRSVPGDVVITIPKDASLGPRRVGALAGTKPGEILESDAVELDVERADAPVSLWVQSPKVFFEHPGYELPTLLVARFADGTSPDARRSSRVRFTSSDETVATVNREGLVRAVAPGRATVTVLYRTDSGAVTLPLDVDVPAPRLAPSRYSLTFAEQAVGTASAPQRITLTNRAIGPIGIIEVKTTPYFAQTNDCPRERLPAGASCTISVMFRPITSGEGPGELEISHTASALPLTIPLRGIGR